MKNNFHYKILDINRIDTNPKEKPKEVKPEVIYVEPKKNIFRCIFNSEVFKTAVCFAVPVILLILILARDSYRREHLCPIATIVNKKIEAYKISNDESKLERIFELKLKDGKVIEKRVSEENYNKYKISDKYKVELEDEMLKIMVGLETLLIFIIILESIHKREMNKYIE